MSLPPGDMRELQPPEFINWLHCGARRGKGQPQDRIQPRGGGAGPREVPKAHSVRVVSPRVAINTDNGIWPSLPLAGWRDSCATLQLWTQIVGKVRLAQAPMVNHWWQVPLYVTARGLTTSPCPGAASPFRSISISSTIALDRAQAGPDRRAGAWSRAHRRFLSRGQASCRRSASMSHLDHAGGDPRCHSLRAGPHPCAPTTPIARTASGDPRPMRSRTEDSARRFLGKASPVHFFWGSFDLAVTRFSGRPAPPHPGVAPNVADWVMREAYSHEVSSCGFWPGGGEPGSGKRDGADVFIPMPIRAHPVSQQRRWHRSPRIGARRWANSCCPMRPCARLGLTRCHASGIPGKQLCRRRRSRPLGPRRRSSCMKEPLSK